MTYPICDQLLHLKEEGRVPFHMPGHKRKKNEIFQDITAIDITEITDYDNLHHPEGMILESMDILSKIYHSKKSWYLVNGSTVGLLSAISAVCNPGDYIMVARNCHKAVYNAIRLLHLHPVYLYPSYDEDYDMLQGIGQEQLPLIEKKLCENDKIKAIVITSPTYEGVVSDISAIKKITQKYQVPLIVDEAHGAHFVYHDYFPKSAVECGADLVIQSAHKTLPSFTQTAFLHCCSDLVREEDIEEMLSIYETSSPSYLLMASAEYGAIYTQNHPDKVQEYVDNLIAFRRKCAQLKNIHLLEKDEVAGFDYDCGKLVFVLKNSLMDGKELFSTMLQRFHIEFEMETAFYCIAMTSINDSKDDFKALEKAIFTLDQELSQRFDHKREEERREIASIQIEKRHFFDGRPEKVAEVWEVLKEESQWVSLDQCCGRIAADYIYLYPPGIPILTPGEKIGKEMVENMRYYLYNGYNVPSIYKEKIKVLKEKI